jgi:hypothetical protein
VSTWARWRSTGSPSWTLLHQIHILRSSSEHLSLVFCISQLFKEIRSARQPSHRLAVIQEYLNTRAHSCIMMIPAQQQYIADLDLLRRQSFLSNLFTQLRKCYQITVLRCLN